MSISHRAGSARSNEFSKKRVLLTALCLSLLVLALGVMSASAAPTCTTDCYVNGSTGNDGNDGLTPGSALATIQAAVSQVSSGGTIHVAAGNYLEQVHIPKSLKLVGADPMTTIIKAPATLPIASSPDSYIIRIAGAAVNAEISGFTISGPGPGACGTIGYGIMIRDGAHGNIHDNKILDVRDTGSSGCQNGNAIMVGRLSWGTTGTADITNNVITGYQKTGILVDNAGSNANIVGNTIAGDGPITYIAENGIQISRGATATITDNTVSGHSYTPYTATSAGMLIYSAGATTITGNTLTNNQMGINLYDSSSTITGNNIFATRTGTGSPGFWGIYLDNAQTSPMTVSITGNTISSNNSAGGSAVGASAGFGANAIALTVSGNLISNWDYGLGFECNTSCGAGFSTLLVNNNSIVGNNHGVDNVMGVTINAENNWWGNANGPSGSGPGSGDSVSVNVDFTPFLTASPQPTKVNLTASNPLICTGGASLNIDFSNMPNLYGYQFKVNYDSTMVTASGAFVNSWFDTSSTIIPPGWGAVCSGGTCKFASSLQAPAPPSGGGGTVATVNFTRAAAGTFNATITDIVLTNIDGFTIPYTSDTATYSFDVCGQASVSGNVSLQGRLTPIDAGDVRFIDLGGNFPDIVVPFDANTGAFTAPSIPVMPNGSNYTMRASHILYVSNQKTFTGVNNLTPAVDHLMPGEVLTNQNTRLWGGDADNSGLLPNPTVGVDISDITCIGGAFGGGAASCGTHPLGSTDINKDTFTNIQDLSLAGGNYGKNPYQAW
ncbi:MAG: right-handed parallel beta-helix repeat-containing protein [Candidatus Promineofilum sp.]|nr:right-handed parallel beta-helix repeat-containing protein [Promineifilum sp.]